MRKLALALVTGVVWVAVHSMPAFALPLTVEGITYSLQIQVVTPTLANFALVITGENSITDTIGGRTGIHAFALTDPNPGDVTAGSVSATLFNNVVTPGTNGYVFHTGGLASGGCNDTGNFFCFVSAASPPGNAVTGPMVIAFSATRSSGDWATYATSQPHLKIDWTGSARNYDLVSDEIGVQTTCPSCTPTPFDVDPVAEPTTLAILGIGLIGLAVVRRSVFGRFA